MIETDDNDSELPPEEFEDGCTLGPSDNTVNTDSDGRPLSGTLGPGDITVNTDSDARSLSGTLGPGDITVDTDSDGRPLSGTLGPCLLYTSPSPRDRTRSRMPSSA